VFTTHTSGCWLTHIDWSLQCVIRSNSRGSPLWNHFDEWKNRFSTWKIQPCAPKL